MNDMKTEKQKKPLFVILLEIAFLSLFVVGCICTYALSLRVLGMIFSGTAKQYLIPQDVVDEHMKTLMLFIYIFGLLELGVIAASIWIWKILQRVSARGGGIASGS